MPEVLRREYTIPKTEKEDNFERDAEFIRMHYPGDAERIIRETLDGYEVVYAEEHGEVVGLATYDIATDNHGEKYLMIGVIVVDEDARESGYGAQLFSDILVVAKTEQVSYLTAIADTTYGEGFLEHVGFDLIEDEVTGREHYRLDIDEV